MSCQAKWKWLSVLFVFICLEFLETLPTVFSQERNLEQPWRLLEEHQIPILQLSSDQEALAFHQHFMPRSRQLPDASTQRQTSQKKQRSKNQSQEQQDTITAFWAAMATIGHIQKLLMLSETPLDHRFFSERLPSDAQQEWILSKPSLEIFNNLFQLQKKLSITRTTELLALPLEHDFIDFAAFHDQSQTIPNSLSWMALLNNRGFEGIEAKLQEYWEQQRQQALPPTSNAIKQAYIQQYISSRLLPIFHTSLLTQALEIEAQAYDVAWKSWYQLEQWHQKEQTTRAIMRLCGKWKWIIHNHQNHGDHKTTMTFHTPGSPKPSHVQPTTVLMNGDTVYLKWTFPQGIQEDSLLLSNHDSRLEGTFTNSLGPHGNISGQRLSPCQH